VADVRLLRPVRVLVAGDDSLLVSGMCEDLMRLGFDAMSTTRRGRVAKLAAIERVNVVILETSGGLRSTAALAGALDELPHRVRILLASPDGAAEQLGYDVIDPDAPLQELAAAMAGSIGALQTNQPRRGRATRKN